MYLSNNSLLCVLYFPIKGRIMRLFNNTTDMPLTASLREDRVERTFHDGPQNWTSNVDGKMFHSQTTPIHDNEDNVIGVVGSTDREAR